MTLVRTGGGVTDIRGPLGGVYFTRDKSGLHCSSKPRRVHQQTVGQRKQRKTFSKARSACLAEFAKGRPRNQLNRWVSYYVYRALNNLPFIYDTKVTGDPVPDCKGIYTLGGQHNGKDFYQQSDSAYFIWWDGVISWNISQTLGVLPPVSWFRVDTEMMGDYLWGGGASGTPTVGLQLQPPPIDYQISTL